MKKLKAKEVTLDAVVVILGDIVGSIKTMGKELNGRIDTLDKKVDRLSIDLRTDIDNLAIITSKGFDRIENRLSQHDRRITVLEEKVL